MADKSPRSAMSKKSEKSLKEKRADKKTKSSGEPIIDGNSAKKNR